MDKTYVAILICRLTTRRLILHMNINNMNKDTACVHAGSIADPLHGGVNSPIYTSSAYRFLDQDESRYPRYFNTPNQKAVVDKLCALEGGEAGMVFSSGMAAISAVFAALLKSGDHVVMQDRIYGGTYNFAQSRLQTLGISYSLVTGQNLNDYQAAIQKNTRLLYFETPANPLLDIMDISELANLAREQGLTSVIDNTFASPINQNPIPLGIDVVIHSGTKYLGGHSDLCFGALITNSKINNQILPVAVNWGGNLDAMTCYQIERSLKTLSLRVQRQNDNALKVARAMDDTKAVHTVYYPGLESHPGYMVAKNQMSGFGGMLSFILNPDQKSAESYCRSLKLIKAAVSLGGVETTITIPAITSHSKMSSADRAKLGIDDNLMRLSLGIEDFSDLIHDINQALL